MAARKKNTEKVTPKKSHRSRKIKETNNVINLEEEDPFPKSMSLHGEIFWEYRAKTAEYEYTLLQLQQMVKALNLEKSDPKYKKLFELMQKEEVLKGELKQHAELLRGVQIKVANKLGLELQTFLKACTINHETGVVRIID